ncbi:MAG: sulfatase [Acidobacteria bacterium]|nr:sulfatase [Acidobacteriota bacterium]
MKRLFPLLLLLLMSFTLIDAPSHARQPNRKLNVLFIAVDDLRPELGAYGNALIQTPNIDKLAAQGTRFELAYCQYPLCNPSRTSLFTGRHPTTTGVLDNRTWFRAAHPDFITMPQHFKANGYKVLRTGKQFHGGIDDTEAWTEGGETRQFTGAVNTTAPGQVAANSDRIVTLEGNGESHGDYKSATRAIEYLEKYKDQPFFLALGFAKPHSPPTAPKRMIEMYDTAKIKLPPDFAPRPKAPPGFPEISVPPRSSDLFIGRDASETEAREVIRAYMASTTFTDYNVGRVIEALDRLKLRDNTVIVFWGDHGYHLGEKGKWSKHNSLFEIGTRVPLIFVTPKGKPQVARQTVQLLDMYPTLVELCGLPMPAGQQGHSLAPVLRNVKAQWNHPAYTVTFFQNKLGKAVRTDRWRYAEWDDGKAGAMLFDHTKDPHELKNLADNPAYAKTVAEMKKLIQQMPYEK